MQAQFLGLSCSLIYFGIIETFIKLLKITIEFCRRYAVWSVAQWSAEKHGVDVLKSKV